MITTINPDSVKKSDTWFYFNDFARKQLKTKDYDPFHGLLIEVQKGLDPEQAVWLSFLYMAFYNPASAYYTFLRYPYPTRIPEDYDKLHIGKQRRNLITTSVTKHINSLVELSKNGGAKEYLTKDFTNSKEDNWKTLLNNLRTVWGNGRWAAYTSADMFHKVNVFDVIPSTMEIDEASGPRRGVCDITGMANSSPSVVLEEYARWIHKQLSMSVVEYPEYARLGVDMAITESLLCDFHGLKKGRYYVGRDIDRMHMRIQKVVSQTGESFGVLYRARQAVFGREYLSELNGRIVGIDLDRCKLFRDFGIIADYADNFF
ncbi:MAG TPA: hypothetical protein EYN67_06800 [Flavobacteriales bacterium]|nr:hypothetical protein [Flavobacteriales bacterium]